VADVLANNDGLIGLSAAVDTALQVSKDRGERVFVVGGVVRDALMGRKVGEHDLDIVVEGQGIPFAHQLAAKLGCSVKVHDQFLTVKLIAPFGLVAGEKNVGPFLDEIDVATSREEIYERPGALPTVRPATIDRDLWRRDFSSNAIALTLESYDKLLVGSVSCRDLEREAIDPCGGLSDIQAATLRVLHPRSFVDDPTRLFRAVRYLVRLSFHFDMTTLAAFLEAVKSGALATLSPRRVWNEVLAAFDESAPSEVLQEYVQRGLFSNLPIITVDNQAWLFESFERLELLRPVLGPELFFESAKVLVIAGILRDGREDIARAVHEGNKVLRRASEILEAEKSPAALRTIPDVAAAYAVHCTDELKKLLAGCLREARG
jgi:tRNA nucleotidyltransferase (CCA-adding enzyme)